MKRTELEVGDIINVKNTFNDHNVKIYRVTKTMAIAKREGFDYETRFRRCVIWGNTAKIVNDEQYNTTHYTVLTIDKPKDQL